MVRRTVLEGSTRLLLSAPTARGRWMYLNEGQSLPRTPLPQRQRQGSRQLHGQLRKCHGSERNGKMWRRMQGSRPNRQPRSKAWSWVVHSKTLVGLLVCRSVIQIQHQPLHTLPTTKFYLKLMTTSGAAQSLQTRAPRQTDPKGTHLSGLKLISWQVSPRTPRPPRRPDPTHHCGAHRFRPHQPTRQMRIIPR